MKVKDWIINNIDNPNKKLKTEEDLKNKVILPFLEELGYTRDDMGFERSLDIQVGTKKVTVFSDIEISVDGEIQLLIDTKNPHNSISEKDILQSVSYAKLVSTPPAIYAVTTNGLDCIVTNIFTGQRFDEIPEKNKLIRDINKTRKKRYTDFELREIKSVLITIMSQDELYKVINNCKDIIEKKGLIRTDQSFREMTKILLVKMFEERRVREGKGQNRFILEYIKATAKINKEKELDAFKRLFSEAKSAYPNIYTDTDESIKINDNECIKGVIKNLETWSFLGTGDDIKGAVYEIFLKSTLRGDFDQYFTPREIVDFMVKYADPNIGDIILDPACGSGGFLIQAFLYVNQKIVNSPFSEVESKKKYNNLIDKCLWGNEADEDLQVLAKINLIMHGDGYNNIYQGDTLKTDKLLENYYDIIMTNPPFTIKYEFEDILSNYELGLEKKSEELDILFVEKCIKCLKPGRDLYIILPEGLLNNKSYIDFRIWLLSKVYLLAVISLPEGAFIPFGQSVSKTCILCVRKKDGTSTNKPEYIFLGNAKEIGYETGKRNYKIKSENDLQEFLIQSQLYFDDIHTTSNGGECGWIKQEFITNLRIDANYLLNILDKEKLQKNFNNLIKLSEVCYVENIACKPKQDSYYYYLEVPDISPNTGLISNIRYVKGNEISSDRYIFHGGDILFTRINTRKNRITIIPDMIEEGLVSEEVYILKLKDNNYIKYKTVLCSLLQSDMVKNQIVRLSTGSSSSRARVHYNDLLEYVYVPVPDEDFQENINDTYISILNGYWNASQTFLKNYVEVQKQLASTIDKNSFRSV